METPRGQPDRQLPSQYALNRQRGTPRGRHPCIASSSSRCNNKEFPGLADDDACRLMRYCPASIIRTEPVTLRPRSPRKSNVGKEAGITSGEADHPKWSEIIKGRALRKPSLFACVALAQETRVTSPPLPARRPNLFDTACVTNGRTLAGARRTPTPSLI